MVQTLEVPLEEAIDGACFADIINHLVTLGHAFDPTNQIITGQRQALSVPSASEEDVEALAEGIKESLEADGGPYHLNALSVTKSTYPSGNVMLTAIFYC